MPGEVDLSVPANRHSFTVGPYEDLLNEARQVKSRLIELGVRVPVNCRIEKYREAVERFIGAATRKAPFSPNEMAILRDAILQISDLLLITSALPGKVNDEKLQRALQDAVRGSADRRKSDRRDPLDRQFELLIGAMCVRAGRAVDFDEPDVIVEEANVRFAIAAKRLHSEKSMEKAVRKARRQIVCRSSNGVIALDISGVINPDHAIAIFPSQNLAIASAVHLVQRFVHERVDRLLELIRSRHVCGLVAVLSIPVLVDGMRIASVQRFQVTNTVNLADPRCKALRDLTFGLMESLPENSTVPGFSSGGPPPSTRSGR
jgi:hypothetical protein